MAEKYQAAFVIFQMRKQTQNKVTVQSKELVKKEQELKHSDLGCQRPCSLLCPFACDQTK